MPRKAHIVRVSGFGIRRLRRLYRFLLQFQIGHSHLHSYTNTIIKSFWVTELELADPIMCAVQKSHFHPVISFYFRLKNSQFLPASAPSFCPPNPALMSAYLPCILLPDSSNSIFSFSLKSSTTSPPRSQIVTVPAPYCPFGISPSKSAYSREWSSVRIASRFMPDSVGGVFGMAKLLRTPSISSLRS